MSDIPIRYKSAIEIFEHSPQFELTPEEKAEVESFEKSLSEGRFPAEYNFLLHKIKEPQEDIIEISQQKSGLETICLDWFVLTKSGNQFLHNLGYTHKLNDTNKLKAFLVDQLTTYQVNDFVDCYIQSRKWAQKKLEDNLKSRLQYNTAESLDLHFFSLLNNPKQLLKNLVAAHELRFYYSAIDATLRSEASSNINDAKGVMVSLHQNRLNELIAEIYRLTFVLLEQYRLLPNILSSKDINTLMHEFGLLKLVDTNDLDKMAKLYSILDKYITGLDVENSYARLESVIQHLITQLQKSKGRIDGYKNTYDIATIINESIDANKLKILFETILKDYDLLKASTSSTEPSKVGNGQWAVKMSKTRESLSVNASDGIIWIPQNFRRKLSQKKPVGVIPLLNHEVMHVLQHRNGANLGINLLEKDRAARASIWFEVGATEMEDNAFYTYFDIQRGPNLHYLRALQTQVKGGSLSDSILTFYNSLLKSGDIYEGDEGIEFAVERTMRIFKNGTELATHNRYITNYEPLEFAEEELLVKNLPQNLHWLLYVGRANFQTLAELHRIGWLNREDIFIPDKKPSDIAFGYLLSTKSVDMVGVR